MEVHSCPKVFDLDKYSYLNFLVNCCFSDYDKDGLIEKMREKINGYTAEKNMPDIYELENLIIDNLLYFVSSLPCVKISIEK